MAEVRSIYDDVTLLQQQVAALQTQVSTLETNLGTANNTIASLSNQIATINSNLTDTGWVPLTLNSGWSMDDYTTETPAYRKIGKIVMLKGLVNATAAADRIIATLPEGCRPANGWYNRFNCVLNQNEYVNIQINPNGQIIDYTKTTSIGRGFLSLCDVCFIAN